MGISLEYNELDAIRTKWLKGEAKEYIQLIAMSTKAQIKKIVDEGIHTGAFDKDKGVDVTKMYNLWLHMLEEVK